MGAIYEVQLHKITMPINQKLLTHTVVMCANVFVRKDGKYLLIKRSSQKQFAPNVIHPIGGKINANENPYLAATREVFEEAGITVKNMRLEAVILEIAPHKKVMPHNWLVFHFSADYESGKIITTDEGELVLLTPEEIVKQKLFPSVREVIHYILNPDDGNVFATFEYNDEGNIVQATEKIDICKT